MKSFEYTVKDPVGLHARPAGKMAACAKQFASEIVVSANGKEADGKRLLALMGLGAICGSTLVFRIWGEDEDAAAAALEDFCRQHLNGGDTK